MKGTVIKELLVQVQEIAGGDQFDKNNVEHYPGPGVYLVRENLISALIVVNTTTADIVWVGNRDMEEALAVAEVKPKAEQPDPKKEDDLSWVGEPQPEYTPPDTRSVVGTHPVFTFDEVLQLLAAAAGGPINGSR